MKVKKLEEKLFRLREYPEDYWKKGLSGHYLIYYGQGDPYYSEKIIYFKNEEEKNEYESVQKELFDVVSEAGKNGVKCFYEDGSLDDDIRFMESNSEEEEDDVTVELHTGESDEGIDTGAIILFPNVFHCLCFVCFIDEEWKAIHFPSMSLLMTLDPENWKIMISKSGKEHPDIVSAVRDNNEWKKNFKIAGPENSYICGPDADLDAAMKFVGEPLPGKNLVKTSQGSKYTGITIQFDTETRLWSEVNENKEEASQEEKEEASQEEKEKEDEAKIIYTRMGMNLKDLQEEKEKEKEKEEAPQEEKEDTNTWCSIS